MAISNAGGDLDRLSCSDFSGLFPVISPLNCVVAQCHKIGRHVINTYIVYNDVQFICQNSQSCVNQVFYQNQFTHFAALRV